MHFNLFPLIYIFIILHFKQVCPAPDSISGQFELRIEKFSQFANGPIRQIKYGQPKYIRGLHWRLNAFVNEEQNGKKSLHCFVAVINSDTNWHCAVHATAEIIVGEKKIKTKIFQGFVNRIDIIREWNLIEEIDKLLEHCQSSKSDVVLLSVNLKMDPPTGRSFPFNDVLLVKNDEYDLAVPIKINKKLRIKSKNGLLYTIPNYGSMAVRTMAFRTISNGNGQNFFVRQLITSKLLLALHSSFFDRLFFNNTEGSSSSYSSSSISFQPVVQLRPATVNYQPILQLNPPSTRENFYRMLLVLQYGDSFLKDTNVEDILRLAVRYEIDEVQGKCAKFLLDPKCQKTKLGSFRIAFSHGLNITKDLILKSMTREDFSEGKNLIEHHKEMEMLSTEASHEFNERYHQLFPEAQKDHKNKKQKVGQMDIDGPMIDN